MLLDSWFILFWLSSKASTPKVLNLAIQWLINVIVTPIFNLNGCGFSGLSTSHVLPTLLSHPVTYVTFTHYASVSLIWGLFPPSRAWKQGAVSLTHGTEKQSLSRIHDAHHPEHAGGAGMETLAVHSGGSKGVKGVQLKPPFGRQLYDVQFSWNPLLADS